MEATKLKFGILGAGCIGSYIGAHLTYAGIDTLLVGRQKLAQEIRGNGLRITSVEGKDFYLKPEQIQYTTKIEALSDRDIVLLTVKSVNTAEAAQSLKQILPVGKTVVSCQNGVRNAEIVRSFLPGIRILKCMVPYNVVWRSKGLFHCGTSGFLIIEKQDNISKIILSELHRSGLIAKEHKNIQDILWGKLIFNLNNSINALAGIPLHQQLSQSAYRKILAATMHEALQVLKYSGIYPVGSGGLLPNLAPFILSLPDFLFFRVASKMIKVDPQACSSMLQDLQQSRQTEINYINGEIVTLARLNQLSAPINSKLITLVEKATTTGYSPKMSAREMATILGINI
ncbi:MAG: 2-dehydropantoate 2-reductase [Fischerella sp. CENA71]|nr:2-dehydropantoate 2-reductase [Fischerella sp. CENA71]